MEEHADWLLALISQQSDLTLDEIVAAMRKRRIAGSRSAVWRSFRRHNISFKKTLYAAEQKRADGARALLVRIQPQLLAGLDAWISQQNGSFTRPEAIRRLIEFALKAKQKTQRNGDK